MIDHQTRSGDMQFNSSMPSAGPRPFVDTAAQRSLARDRAHPWARRAFSRSTTADGGYRGKVLYELDSVIARRLGAASRS